MIIVERIEGQIVVCENSDRSVSTWPLNMFPDGVKEGDVVEQRKDGFWVNEEETQKRKQKIEARFRRLQNRD